MLTHVGDLDPVAVVGDRRFTGLRDVTSDVSALDAEGLWIVVVSFEGEAVCGRFDSVGSVPVASPAWVGPPADAWSSNLEQDAFGKGVVDIREAIAAGRP